MKIDVVDIIILTFQRFHYLREVIDEIGLRTKMPYRLIVVDNGSTDGTREWIEKMHEEGKIWKYVFTEKNEFMTEAFNKGVKLVESKYFITTQDDIVPPQVNPCWLTQIVGMMDEYPEYDSISMNFGNCSFFRFLRKKYGQICWKNRE